MEILRTDGSYKGNDNHRLEMLRSMLKYHNLKINTLHDHKGELTVYWVNEPNDEQKDIVRLAWEFLFEYNITHKVGVYE